MTAKIIPNYISRCRVPVLRSRCYNQFLVVKHMLEECAGSIHLRSLSRLLMTQIVKVKWVVL